MNPTSGTSSIRTKLHHCQYSMHQLSIIEQAHFTKFITEWLGFCQYWIHRSSIIEQFRHQFHQSKIAPLSVLNTSVKYYWTGSFHKIYYWMIRILSILNTAVRYYWAVSFHQNYYWMIRILWFGPSPTIGKSIL